MCYYLLPGMVAATASCSMKSFKTDEGWPWQREKGGTISHVGKCSLNEVKLNRNVWGFSLNPSAPRQSLQTPLPQQSLMGDRHNPISLKEACRGT